MRHADARRIEQALRETMGTTDADNATIAHMSTKLMDIRDLNPKCFHAAMLLIISAFMVSGDAMVGVSGADVTARVTRMAALQAELTALINQATQDTVTELLTHLRDEALDEEPLPKAKLN